MHLKLYFFIFGNNFTLILMMVVVWFVLIVRFNQLSFHWSVMSSDALILLLSVSFCMYMNLRIYLYYFCFPTYIGSIFNIFICCSRYTWSASLRYCCLKKRTSIEIWEQEMVAIFCWKSARNISKNHPVQHSSIWELFKHACEYLFSLSL